MPSESKVAINQGIARMVVETFKEGFRAKGQILPQPASQPASLGTRIRNVNEGVILCAYQTCPFETRCCSVSGLSLLWSPPALFPVIRGSEIGSSRSEPRMSIGNHTVRVTRFDEAKYDAVYQSGEKSW